MIPRILTTDNDSHSPEAWAALTADMVFPIDPDIAPERRPLAMRVQADIAMALVKHHAAVIDTERSKLKAHGDEHLHAPHDATQTADEAIQVIKAVVKDSPWAEKWNDPKVVKVARDLIAGHMHDAQRVERKWFADPSEHATKTRNAKHYGPNHRVTEHGLAYFNAHRQGGDAAVAEAKLKFEASKAPPAPKPVTQGA